MGCALVSAIAAEVANERVETVRFADPRWPAVRVVRGVPSGAPALAPQAAGPPVFRATPANTEIVTFGDGRGESVRVIRGSGVEPRVAAAANPRVETVRFGGAGASPVNIVRGRWR
jgi:hypothetical protein